MPSPHSQQPRPRVPAHVLTAFLLDDTDADSAQDLGVAWGNGVLLGAAALVPAHDHTHFSATAREAIVATAHGFRVARPMRTTDGRTSVGGWSASVYEPGEPAARIDETVVVALRLADALRPLDMPDFETHPGSLAEIYHQAEREAWRRCDDTYGPIAAPGQVGHIDVVGTTLYAPSGAPVVTDIVPTAAPRPHGYTAALAMVDGLIYSAVDDGILDRFAHVPDLAALALRAATFRRFVADLHPAAVTTSISNIDSVVELVESYRSATMEQ